MAISANEKLEMINKAKEKLRREGGNSDVFFKDATIWFQNFDGSRDRNGKRTFNILLKSDTFDSYPDEYIAELINQGWNVKFSNKLNDDGEPLYVTLPVEIRFDKYPPDISVIINGKVRKITEETLNELQNVRCERINLRIGPRVWYDDKTDTCKVKAYLKGHFYLQDVRDELDEELNSYIGGEEEENDDMPFDI